MFGFEDNLKAGLLLNDWVRCTHGALQSSRLHVFNEEHLAIFQLSNQLCFLLVLVDFEVKVTSVSHLFGGLDLEDVQSSKRLPSKSLLDRAALPKNL